MRAKERKITGIILAFSMVGVGVLSCQTLPEISGLKAPLAQSTASDTENFSLILPTEVGSIRLQIALPYPKAYDALRKYHGFKTQFLEEGRINKIKVNISHIETSFKAEKVIPLTQEGMIATIKVPLGKNYIITVQGMDDLDEVPGALVKGVFTVESSEIVPDVNITPLSTAVAEIVQRVAANNKPFALAIDTQKLADLITEGKSAANPFLVNRAAFSQAIIDGKGKVPSIVPVKPVLKAGNISGSITGLEPGDAAIIFSNDPVSQPFIVVAPPVAEGEDPEPVDYRIDNVPPGPWIVRVVASGYQVQGDSIASLNELSATRQITVSENASASLVFSVEKVGWSTRPTNASGNIGSSDQPQAVVDGSDNIHMVWRQDGFRENEDSGSIFYSRWNGKTWSTNDRFISPVGDEDKFRGSRNPSLAVGIDRTPHVVWSANTDNDDYEGRRIAFSRFDGVKWSKTLLISTNSPDSSVDADHPDIAINPVNNQAFAVWDQLENGVRTVFVSQLQNGAWSEAIRLSETTVQAHKPLITIGTDGVIHVVWEVIGRSQVQYVNWNWQVREFSAIETVPFNEGVVGENIPRSLSAHIDLLNRFHLLRRDQSTLQYIFRSNRSWSRSEPVHEINGLPLTVRSNASVYLDNIGNVNAVWVSSLVDGTPVIRYRRRTNEGWEAPGSTTVTTSPTPIPTAFPSPTIGPTATPAPTPEPVTDESQLGYEDLPNTQNNVTANTPVVVVDSRGRISVLWSRDATDPDNSDVFHTHKSEPESD